MVCFTYNYDKKNKSTKCRYINIPYMDPMGENVTIAWTSQATAKLNCNLLFMSKNMELKVSNWNPHHGYCKKEKKAVLLRTWVKQSIQLVALLGKTRIPIYFPIQQTNADRYNLKELCSWLHLNPRESTLKGRIMIFPSLFWLGSPWWPLNKFGPLKASTHQEKNTNLLSGYYKYTST